MDIIRAVGPKLEADSLLKGTASTMEWRPPAVAHTTFHLANPPATPLTPFNRMSSAGAGLN